MAYDFTGTITEAQWTSLKSFVQNAVGEAEVLLQHLEKEVEFQDQFAAKLLTADHFSGGTSQSAFSGASYTPEDRDDGSVGERRDDGKSTDESLLAFLADRAPDRATYVDQLDMSNGSFCGGDLPWMDVPQLPQKNNAWGAFDDYRTGPLVSYLKEVALPQIQHTRERLEYRVKSALDYREQLLTRIFDLTQAQTDVEKFIQQVDEQFLHVDDGSDQNQDPEAEPISNDDPQPLTTGRDQPQGTQHRNLFKSPPPTRTWPVWPVIRPEKRGVPEMLGTTGDNLSDTGE